MLSAICCLSSVWVTAASCRKFAADRALTQVPGDGVTAVTRRHPAVTRRFYFGFNYLLAAGDRVTGFCDLRLRFQFCASDQGQNLFRVYKDRSPSPPIAF